MGSLRSLVSPLRVHRGTFSGGKFFFTAGRRLEDPGGSQVEHIGILWVPSHRAGLAFTVVGNWRADKLVTLGRKMREVEVETLSAANPLVAMFETVAKAVDLSALQVGAEDRLTDRHEASESPERSLKELRGLGDRGAPFPIVPDSPEGPRLGTPLAEGYRGSFGGEHEDCLTCALQRDAGVYAHAPQPGGRKRRAGTDATGGRPGADAGNGQGPREEARCTRSRFAGGNGNLSVTTERKGAFSGRGGVRGTRRPSVASAQPTVNVRRKCARQTARHDFPVGLVAGQRSWQAFQFFTQET